MDDKIIHFPTHGVPPSVATESEADKKLDGYLKDLDGILLKVKAIASKHGYDSRTVLTDSLYKLVEQEIIDYCNKP